MYVRRSIGVGSAAVDACGPDPASELPASLIRHGQPVDTHRMMSDATGVDQTLVDLRELRREQTPQALARLVVVALFIAMWALLWAVQIPMPVPFLLTLAAEGVFLLIYWRAVFVLPDARSIHAARACMLGAEIIFHTTMVYFLGSIMWLGAFAYVFGLIFSNTFLDLRGGFVYTTGAAGAFVALILLEATGTIPHQAYGDQGPLRFQDPQVVITTSLAVVGVFVSIYLWVNWVGHQLRGERDSAVASQSETVRAREALVQANADLERRVQERTGELEFANAALGGSEELLRSTVESTADGILVVDSDGKVAFGNHRFAEMWHIPVELLETGDDEALLAFAVEQLDDPQAFRSKVQELYQSDREDLDSLLFKDGRVFERYSRPLVRDGGVAGRVWSFRDISERRRFEAQLVHLANHDPLTGLFNRRRFDEELDRHLSEAQRYDLHGALLFLDLDQFKDVNDSRGHRAGDDLLTSLALLLRQRLRETDIIARLGGDEFAVLLPRADAEQANTVAKDLLEAIRSYTFIVGGAPLGITVSLGIVLFPEHGINAGELLSRADMAMYRSKEEGRNRASMFAPEGDWQAQVESRIGWHQRIREALDNDLFVLHAQPILDLATDRISQYELLLRMVGPDGEMIAPSLFLDIAERSGLIQDIDRWVVRRAIELLGEYAAAGRELRLEVNLSGKAFADHDLLTMIQDELHDHGANPANLVLEVTETAAIANIGEARDFVRTLQAIGCGFALDDFGVGFSSFSQLKHLPVDYLKIDGSFVQDLAQNAVDQHLVRAIVSIARGLGKKTIAEFVGDAETVRLLKAYGVDYAQGYHVAKPAPLPPITRDIDAAA